MADSLRGGLSRHEHAQDISSDLTGRNREQAEAEAHHADYASNDSAHDAEHRAVDTLFADDTWQ